MSYAYEGLATVTVVAQPPVELTTEEITRCSAQRRSESSTGRV
ncbi:hypothetical protein PS639_04422 [Pseudomonas fluorescens]|nr:hypothetical protein PS639_04422 [Pseudomonas fluorescens]